MLNIYIIALQDQIFGADKFHGRVVDLHQILSVHLNQLRLYGVELEECVIVLVRDQF